MNKEESENKKEKKFQEVMEKIILNKLNKI